MAVRVRPICDICEEKIENQSQVVHVEKGKMDINPLEKDGEGFRWEGGISGDYEEQFFHRECFEET